MTRGWFGASTAKETLEAIALLKGIAIPKGKSESRLLSKLVSRSIEESKPLEIYIGSCPDYSHYKGRYTFEGLGGGVPLLTQLHLESDTQILKVLDSFDISYKYILMVADVEATDSFFCKKYTDGDESKFLGFLEASVEKTSEKVNQIKAENGLRGEIVSTSFFGLFGREHFLATQKAYEEVLFDRFQNDGSFNMRIVGDLLARMNMYQKMYGSYLGGMSLKEKEVFLIERTIRTMAQYLTISRLILEKSELSCIISHPTTNKSMFNGRNKFLLPGDDGQHPQQTIPVLEMLKDVY